MIKHTLPATLFVRMDTDTGEENILLAEESMSKVLPDDDMVSVVGVYALIKVVRVRREAQILAEDTDNLTHERPYTHGTASRQATRGVVGH